jgi:hypothetical protein
MGGAVVTLKDSAGNTSTATTASDGTFTLKTGTLVPPFFVRVVTSAASGSFPAGTTLYSVSADALATTTINLDVLTDLTVRSWYNSQGVNVDSAFGNPVTAGNVPPNPANVQIIASAAVQAMQLWFGKAGVNVGFGTGQLNPISGAFTANGTGFDAVLHETTETLSNGQVTIVTITDNTTTQTSTVAYNTSTGALTITSTTTAGGTTSTNLITTVIPASTAQQTAINAINTTFTGFFSVLGAKGSQLAVSDITPFMASNLLNDGLNQNQYAGRLVGDFVSFLNGGGVPTVSTRAPFIKSMDLTNGLADVVFNGTLMQGGVSVGALPAEFDEFWFQRSGSAWLIAGDNQIAQTQMLVGAGTSQGAQSGSSTTVEAHLEAPVGNLIAEKVSGGGIFNNSSLGPGNQFSYLGGSLLIQELLVQSSPLSVAIPAGTPFTFNITPASGPAVNYVVPTFAFTNEAIAFTQVNSVPIGSVSSATANYAGKTVTANWTLPKTFPIANVVFSAKFQDLTQGDPSALTCHIGQILTTNATSGTVTIPNTLTCASGQTVTRGDLDIDIFGVNGETTQIRFYFQ